jgi:anthranilate phosphoribosyltransferase
MALGMRHGFVVHGSDGLDEIATTGPASAWEIRDGTLEPRTLEPTRRKVEALAEFGVG